MINNIVLILVIALVISLAGLFCGAEIGIYQLSRLRLRIGVEKKRPLFVILGNIMRQSQRLLITILIGTNLSHYIITSIVIYMLAGHIEGEQTVELFATVLTAPVLFVFAELIPKNIFFHRADQLMPYTAPVLLFFKKLFIWTGILPLLEVITRSFGGLSVSAGVSDSAGGVLREPYIKAIIEDTHEESLLGAVQSEMINRMAGISEITVRSVMTQLDETHAFDMNAGRAAVVEKLKSTAFTRLPVYEGSVENIVGFINIYECLSRREDFADLRDFVKPIKKVSAQTTVIDAIHFMQREMEKIVLIVQTDHSGRERAVGIVTMKDLVEEILGELVEW